MKVIWEKKIDRTFRKSPKPIVPHSAIFQNGQNPLQNGVFIAEWGIWQYFISIIDEEANTLVILFEIYKFEFQVDISCINR